MSESRQRTRFIQCDHVTTDQAHVHVNSNQTGLNCNRSSDQLCLKSSVARRRRPSTFPIASSRSLFIFAFNVFIFILITQVALVPARIVSHSSTPAENQRLVPSAVLSAALNADRLEEALEIFKQQWQLRHSASNVTSNSTSSMVSDQDHDRLASYQKTPTSPLPSATQPPLVRRKRDTDPSESDSDDSYDELNNGLNCTSCTKHGEARDRRIMEIKNDILNKLGLKTAPNVTSKARSHIPPLHHLLDRYGMLSDDPRAGPLDRDQNSEEDDQMAGDQPSSLPDSDSDSDKEDLEEFYVNAERYISFPQLPPRNWNIPSALRSQYFKFSANVLNSHVTRSHLWVYVKPSHQHLEELAAGKNTVAWVVVYQVVRTESGESPTLLHVRAKKKQITSAKGTWVTIEIKKLVSQWFRHPRENLGLVIHSYDNEGRELFVAHPSDLDLDSSQLPFVEVKVETKSINRKRRMVGLNCEENSHEARCCRYPLTVDFEEFGWDWIIAPKRYEANYCSGECPYVFLQKYPHTHLVQQANPSGAPGPCCAPRKLSSISMLYFDDNHNIIYGILPGMVVDRCGCS